MKLALGILLFLVLALGGVLGGVLLFPEWVITPGTLRFAAQKLEATGWKAEWDSVDVRVDSSSPFKRRIDLSFDGFCLKNATAESGLEVCGSRLEVGGRISVFPPSLNAIGPVLLKEGRVRVVDRGALPQASAVQDRDGDEESGGVLAIFRDLQSMASKVELGKFDVDVKELSVVAPDLSLSGSARVSSEALEGTGSSSGLRNWRVDGQVEIGDPSGKRQKIQAAVALSNPGPDLRSPGTIDLQGEYDGSGGPEIVAGVTGRFDESAEGAELDLKVNAEGRRLIEDAPWVSRVSISDCAIGLKPVAKRSEIRLDCPIGVDYRATRVDKLPKLKLPSALAARITARLDTTTPPTLSQRASADLRVELAPLVSGERVFEARGFIDARGAGIPAEFPSGWRLEGKSDLRVRVTDFGKLVALLQGTHWAVPAPVNAMSGTLEAGVSGPISSETLRLPIYLKTRLASRRGGDQSQKLDLDGEGVLALGNSAESPQRNLDFQLKLTDVRLALPRMEIGSVPRLVPDSRIKLRPSPAGEGEPPGGGDGASDPGVDVIRATRASPIRPGGTASMQPGGVTSQGEEASAFTYRVELLTPPGSQLKLLSNLAQAPVPVELRFVAYSDASTTGNLQVNEFPLRLFRRDAIVEKFSLRVDPETKSNPISGKVRLDYTDYVVNLQVYGTTAEPQVKLTSVPPVPEDQLWAVLLFGRTLDDLDPGQTESVGSTRSAVATGAVGLASLYFLASTPVESVGYNPETGAVSIKVRLAEGTSLNVGSASGEIQNVGIRKRLSRYWSFTTGVEPGGSSGLDPTVVSAFLEWVNRY